jgi:hypothetical protein
MTDPEYAVTICDDKGIAHSPEYLELFAKLRRVNADGTRTTVWMGTIDQLGNTLYEANRLCGYAATCKLFNTRPWLQGLAERMNLLLAELKDHDRVRYESGELAVDRGVA